MKNGFSTQYTAHFSSLVCLRSPFPSCIVSTTQVPSDIPSSASALPPHLNLSGSVKTKRLQTTTHPSCWFSLVKQPFFVSCTQHPFVLFFSIGIWVNFFSVRFFPCLETSLHYRPPSRLMDCSSNIPYPHPIESLEARNVYIFFGQRILLFWCVRRASTVSTEDTCFFLEQIQQTDSESSSICLVFMIQWPRCLLPFFTSRKCLVASVWLSDNGNTDNS